MSFQPKYLKYKSKYLNLINQKGGDIIRTAKTTNNKIIKDFLSIPIDMPDIPYKITKYSYEIDNKTLHLIKIKLNSDKDKPILFALGGMSHKSFIGTANIILNKLDLIKTKFRVIYLLEYDSFKETQNSACSQRDIIKKTSKDLDKMYKPELDMNLQIADYINKIIIKLNLNNVHLLGKCNGAWVVSLLLLKSDIYKGLYLAVPGIPFGVDILSNLSIDRLEKINFVFGWLKQDGYKFDWGISYEEKDRYDRIMKQIEEHNKNKLKYKSYMYDNHLDIDLKIYHELYPEMIDDIINTL